MNIRITDEAKAAIHRLEREDKKIIRIRGTMTNSCSIFVDVDLIWDTYNADDVDMKMQILSYKWIHSRKTTLVIR